MPNRALERRIAAIPFWYHRVALPEGHVTPGWAPLAPTAYRLPDRLDGKRVLDLGAWDGYWTFEALARGASEVLAVDDLSDQLGFLGPDATRTWDGFDLCREALGWSSQRCRRETLSVFELDVERHGRFDIVLCFGLLYHLRYPLLALDRIAALCDGEIFVESAIADDFSPYQGGLGAGYSGQQVVMEFYPGDEYGQNAGNWWVPTLLCLGQLVRAAGFDPVTVWRLDDEPATDLVECRGFAHGVKPHD